MAVKLFDSGRREHAYIRDGLESFLAAVVRLTRAVTTVRSSVALLNGVMMSAIAAICRHEMDAAAAFRPAPSPRRSAWCSGSTRCRAG